MSNFILTAVEQGSNIEARVWSDPETDSRPARTTGSDARQHRHYVVTVDPGDRSQEVSLRFLHPTLDVDLSGWLVEGPAGSPQPWIESPDQNRVVVTFTALGHHTIGVQPSLDEPTAQGFVYIHFDVEAAP